MSSDVIIRVIDAVAAAENVEPEELDYRLHDYIDSEILMKLSEMEKSPWELTFEMADHQVTVSREGPVIVDGVRYPRTESIEH